MLCLLHFFIGRIDLLPVNLRQKCVEFVGMRLGTRKMGSCLWLAMCVGFLFVDLVTCMKGVKGANAAPNATPVISVKKVSVTNFL